jgi:hypothetical protein
MIAVTFHDVDGRIMQTGRLLRADECDATVAASDILAGWAEGTWGAGTHYIADGEVTERPRTGLPTAHTLSQGTDWTVPNVPDGTRVYVDGEDLGATDPLGLVLSFAAPGVWRVDLDPPWPWQPASCEVTVT